MKKYIIFLFFLFNLTVQWHDGALDIGVGNKARAQYGEEYSELDPPRWGAGGIQLPGNDEDPGGGFDPGYIQPPDVGYVPGVDPINPGDTEINPPGGNGGIIIIIKEEDEDDKDKRDPLPESERPVIDWGTDPEINDDDDKWETEPPGGGDEGGENPPPGTDPNKKPDPKKPGIRDDCDEQASLAAKSVKGILNVNEDVKNKVTKLKENAKSILYEGKEFSMRIDFTNDKIYKASDIKESSINNNFVASSFAASTVFALHTHNDRNGLPSPSAQDIQTILVVNRHFYKNYGSKNEIYNFHGGIIFAYDGSEYLIFISDQKKANDFFVANDSLFMEDGLGIIKNEKLRNEINRIIVKLEDEGYSETDAFDYALAYILEEKGTGLRIQKKESTDKSYRELKTYTEKIEESEDTETEKNDKVKYIPKICPDK